MGSFTLQILAVQHTLQVLQTTDDTNEKIDFINYKSYLPFSWPEVYHNSFWSNYYTNYWQPSSVYYNSFSLPSSYTLPPSYTNLSSSIPLPPYEYEEPLDLYNYQEPSQTFKSIKSLSHGYYSKMVSKRYPFVNGHVAMFT